MNENHRLIKDVSNALNYYMDRTRREEGFDLSGVLKPSYDVNKFKFQKLFGYSTVNDKNVRKILMPDISLPRVQKEESEELKLRERFYKDELKYHLKWDRQRKSLSKEFGFSSKPPRSTGIDKKRFNSAPKVPTGLLTIRSTHTPTLSKREKLSMLNITSKIMSASSELCFPKEDIQLMKHLAEKKQGSKSTCYAKKSVSQTRRDEFERRKLIQRQREFESEQLENRSKSAKQDSKHDFEDDLSDYETQIETKSDEDEKENKTENNRKRSNESSQKSNEFAKSNPDELEDLKEITSGDLIKYRVVVKTSDRLGSSTKADIKLKLYGSKGKSKMHHLNKSKTHHIPFRKGNTDIFDIDCYDIGKLIAIQIGHTESEIDSSWHMEFLRIEDHENNICYGFESNDWFSSKSDDGLTTRVLFKQTVSSLASDTDSFSESISISGSARSSKTSISKKSTDESVKRSKSKSSKSSKHSISFEEKVETKEITNNDADEMDEYLISKQTREQSPVKIASRNSSSSSSSSFIKPASPIEKKKTQSSSSRPTSSKHSTSSSVRAAEEEIGSRKFNFSPSPDLTHPKQGNVDFNVQVINTTKVKLNVFEAVEMNQLDVLKEIIIRQPLEITRTDSNGRTLMSIACELGFEKIVKYLADNNDSLLTTDTPLGYFPVHACAQNNHLNCLVILYEYGASLHSKTNDGQTPLHIAAKCGHYDIVKWLVEHNVNVNIYDNNKETAYDLAKKYEHFKVANCLAEPSGKPFIKFDYSTQVSKVSNDIELTESLMHYNTTVKLEEQRESPYMRPEAPIPNLHSPNRAKSSASVGSAKSSIKGSIKGSAKSSIKGSIKGSAKGSIKGSIKSLPKGSAHSFSSDSSSNSSSESEAQMNTKPKSATPSVKSNSTVKNQENVLLKRPSTSSIKKLNQPAKISNSSESESELESEAPSTPKTPIKQILVEKQKSSESEEESEEEEETDKEEEENEKEEEDKEKESNKDDKSSIKSSLKSSVKSLKEQINHKQEEVEKAKSDTSSSSSSDSDSNSDTETEATVKNSKASKSSDDEDSKHDSNKKDLSNHIRKVSLSKSTKSSNNSISDDEEEKYENMKKSPSLYETGSNKDAKKSTNSFGKSSRPQSRHSETNSTSKSVLSNDERLKSPLKKTDEKTLLNKFMNNENKKSIDDLFD